MRTLSRIIGDRWVFIENDLDRGRVLVKLLEIIRSVKFWEKQIQSNFNGECRLLNDVGEFPACRVPRMEIESYRLMEAGHPASLNYQLTDTISSFVYLYSFVQLFLTKSRTMTAS